jgi:hypothetical protein
VCGAADAVKESVTAYTRATATAADADAAIEDFLFSAGGGHERWLHECVVRNHINNSI